MCGRNLYYISENSQYGSVFYKTPATDFSNKDDFAYKRDSSYYFDSLTSDGESVYALTKSYNDSEYLSFEMFNTDLKNIFLYDITATAKDLAGSDRYSLSGFNAISNYISLTVLCNNGEYNTYFIMFTQNGDTKRAKTTPYIYNSNKKTYCYYVGGDYRVFYYDRDENGKLYNYKVAN